MTGHDGVSPRTSTRSKSVGKPFKTNRIALFAEQCFKIVSK
jgi:hypothetical protein